MTNLFDFSDPAVILRKQTQVSGNRKSGTVTDTVRHSMIHTESPNSSLHHTIIAACPHPTKERADRGDYYMVAYVSIPFEWYQTIDTEFATVWDISFVGPAGIVQRLPVTLADMEDLLTDRVYIGFDWLWLTDSGNLHPQISYDSIKDKLVSFVRTMRERAEGTTQ